MLWIGYNATGMATAAEDVLMTGVADLVPGFFIFLCMGVEHVGRMGEVVAGTVVAKSLAVAVEASLGLCVFYISMFDSPSEIGVRIGDGTDDDRRFDQSVVAAAHDGHGMTEVALDANAFDFIPLFIQGYMLVIVAAEAAREGVMTGIVGVGFPIHALLREVGLMIKPFQFFYGASYLVLIGECIVVVSMDICAICCGGPIDS